MQEGWDATGLLAPLWARVGGRDELARLTGIGGNTLSSYNSGKRKLGMQNAAKIADALDVSLYDVGASRPHPNDFAASLLGQAAAEVIRRPPDDDPRLLEELAGLMEEAARVLREAASRRLEGTL